MNFSFSKENLIETEKSRAIILYWLKRIFIDDWLMKLVALLITFALWLGVTGLQTPTSRTLNNVALNPLLAKNLEITNDFVKNVDIEVTGDQNKVNDLLSRDLIVKYDATDLAEGEREVSLTSQNINVELPSGVTVTKISPEKIIFKIEEVIESDVPVIPEPDGDLIEGYEVYNTKTIPDRVRVRGPRNFVEKLLFISTDKIDLSGRRGDFVAQKIPINVSENKRISLVDAVTVTVTFRIGKKRIERLFVVPYETENRVGKASILLYGAGTILENLSIEDIEVVESEKNSSKLLVNLPENIKNEVEVRNIKFRE